jgi:hypothetical protein
MTITWLSLVPLKLGQMRNGMKKVIIAISALMLTGCTGTINIMPRDSGKVCKGTVYGNGFSGSITIDINGEIFTGPIMRTDAGYSLIQQYSGTAAAEAGGSRNVKGILSSEQGHGLRCEFTSNGSGGSGICVDDNKKVYDAIVQI